MHDMTLIPYINAAIGFFATFCSSVSSALMSTSSHTPSSASDLRMTDTISRGRVMSWMQSKVVTKPKRASPGIGSSRTSTKRTFFKAREDALSRAIASA
jgi:hypothetical protein